jgi:hypothetical protein
MTSPAASRGLGLIARLCVRERAMRTWETILEVANEIDAS